MCSTEYVGHVYQHARRRLKENVRWSANVVRRPDVVGQYNKYMGGVDKSDQLIASYNVLMKSMRNTNVCKIIVCLQIAFRNFLNML